MFNVLNLFKNKFNGVRELLDLERKITEIAYLKRNEQWILYLITKHISDDRPTYSDIFTTLQNTRWFCIDNKINTLA